MIRRRQFFFTLGSGRVSAQESDGAGAVSSGAEPKRAVVLDLIFGGGGGIVHEPPTLRGMGDEFQSRRMRCGDEVRRRPADLRDPGRLDRGPGKAVTCRGGRPPAVRDLEVRARAVANDIQLAGIVEQADRNGLEAGSSTVRKSGQNVEEAGLRCIREDGDANAIT